MPTYENKLKHVSARMLHETWEKVTKYIKKRTMQDTLTELCYDYDRLQKEVQDLRLKVHVYKQRLKDLE